MSQDFITAVKALAAEKNIPEEEVIEAIKAALITAYRKDYGNKNQEIEVELTGNSIESATFYLVKEVVDEVDDEDLEISAEEVRKIKKDADIGDEVRIEVTPMEYGRIAAQAAKQVILQRIQEAEKESLYQLFKDREDSIVSATVNRVEGTNVYLSIDRNTVFLPQKQQIPGEQYFPGKRITVYLDKVRQTNKGPQLSISRIHPNLVKKLLEREIPEVASGDVTIEAIARDPGSRTKIAVASKDPKVDPVGACVGQKGMRVNIITDELSGERIDMIEYDPSIEGFIARSLQPAKISHVVVINKNEDFDENTRRKIKKRAAVFVEEEERAMAIGKKGQNIRLATDLTDYELDMYNIEELEMFMEKLVAIREE
jgi:transcription termination/antitermination protein NusA